MQALTQGKSAENQGGIENNNMDKKDVRRTCRKKELSADLKTRNDNYLPCQEQNQIALAKIYIPSIATGQI